MKTRILTYWVVWGLLGSTAIAQTAVEESLKVYAAAVAKAPLTDIATAFERSTGRKVTLTFDTAGATVQRFEADPKAALLITTLPLIRNAEKAGALHDGTSVPFGSTVAAVAMPPKSAKPDISSPEKLKVALLAARRIAVSDPKRGATVGTHFMKVVEALRIHDQIVPKITFASDGLATLQLVLEGGADFGVSQSSEILQASPEAMVGPFPKEFALSTEFALWYRNTATPEMHEFVAEIMSPASLAKLTAGGIMPAELSGK